MEMQQWVNLTEPEIDKRLPLWVALSNLWLDTELQHSDYSYIAKTIVESEFSVEEAIKIHKYEVAPAVLANLFSVAGEWAGFDEKWLRKRCEKFANMRH